jgi:Zn-dependent peptidase ImmA (M78 family)
MSEEELKIGLPQSVLIAGLPFTIVEESHLDMLKTNNSYGMTSFAEQKIWIRPDLAPQMKRSTLVHEMLHALLFTAGCNFPQGEEERIVGIAEANVYRWLKENDFSWVKE